jgi:hypothetical protein
MNADKNFALFIGGPQHFPWGATPVEHEDGDNRETDQTAHVCAEAEVAGVGRFEHGDSEHKKDSATRRRELEHV